MNTHTTFHHCRIRFYTFVGQPFCTIITITYDVFHIVYLPATEDVFTVLFEYCRVSDSTQEWILENLIPNKLTSVFDNIWRHVVTSLVLLMNCQTLQGPKFKLNLNHEPM